MANIAGAEYTSVTITTSVTLQMVHAVITDDDITIAEDISYLIDPIDLSVNDSAVISENLEFTTHPYEAYVFDSVIVTDVRQPVHSLINLSVFDTVLIGELAAYHRVLYELSVYTSIVATESITTQLPGMLYDDIAIATNVDLIIPLLILSTYDEITISDTIDKEIGPLAIHDNIYIRTVFNESITDSDSTTIANTIVSTQTIFASAARTATVGYYISEAFKVSSAIQLRFHFDVTAEVGTSSLGSIIQTSIDKETWYDVLTIDAITAIGQYTSTLTNPGIYVRVKSVITGTGFTFSCLMTKHMATKSRPRLVYA